jgi:hypothetical protein
LATLSELLREGKNRELWERCCGFLDLNMKQFMNIQHELLLEQLELLKNCELGKKVMRGAQPTSIEEFREQVPVTSYSDYSLYLLDKREDVLPEKPIFWQRTSGRSGEYPCKWIPVTRRQYEDAGDAILAMFILASSRGKGDVTLEEHDKLLYGAAPPPYVSGSFFRRIEDMKVFNILPPIEKAEGMTFEERLNQGFQMGMSEGLDVIFAISSVLVAIGERFGQGGGLKRALATLRDPRRLPRLLKAVVKSKLAHRPIMPKDIWSLKGLVAGGTDNGIYREKIKELWGMYPLDIYGCTEALIIAPQTWDYEGMTFIPHLNFLEFMPEAERKRWLEDPFYRPRCLLLDEVEAGESYATVITNFRGGTLVRYFLGDVIKITALSNQKLNINIPQMVFESRADGLIDIAGFTRLTERMIWEAIENAGIIYNDWSVRKEKGGKPVLRLYLELKPGYKITEDEAAATIHAELKKVDSDYADLEDMLGLKPLQVTILPEGSFQAYVTKQREAGADLAHLKPPHVNPTDAVIDKLLTPVP